MGTIIPLFTLKEQPCSELAVLRRLARLDRATSEEMRRGLELLCVLDPGGFEVALPAARPDPYAEAELGEPVAVCGRCGSMVALFPEDLTWRHYRGAADVFGVQEAFVAGHEPAVEWYLPEELAEKLPVSFDPRIEQHLKVGEQRLAARAPPVGLQDPVHYRGGLGRTGRAPPQQCRHSVLRCPVRKVFQPAGLQLNAMIGQLPGPPPEVRVTDQPGQFEAIKNLEAMSRKRSRLGLRRRG